MNRTNMNTSDMDTSKDTSGLMIAGNMIRVTGYLGPTYIRMCPECNQPIIRQTPPDRDPTKGPVLVKLRMSLRDMVGYI